MKRYNHIVARKIHDSYFLIDTKQTYPNDKCSLFEINEIGYFIWNEIDGSRSVEEIANRLREQIIGEIIYADLLSDVKEFFELLIEQQFLEA